MGEVRVGIDVRDFELLLEDARLDGLAPRVEDLGVMLDGKARQRPVKQTLIRKKLIKLPGVPWRILARIKARLIPSARICTAVDERI